MNQQNTPTEFINAAASSPSAAESLEEKVDSKRNSHHSTDSDDIEPVEESEMPDLEKSASSRMYGATRISSRDPSKHVISFASDDKEEPDNWSKFWKLYSMFVAIMMVLNSTISSSLAAGATKQLSAHFGITSQEQLVLPTSIFLVGYVIGPILVGPLSEQYGRKDVMLFCFFIYTVFSIASAWAPNWAAFIIFRLIVGAMGSAPIAIVGGICADVYHSPLSRGRAMAIFMVATCWGPVIGPIVSGYTSEKSWRWPFWFGSIFAGFTWPFLILYRETYAPTILVRRAKYLRKSRSDPTIMAPLEFDPPNIRHILLVVCARAVKMLFLEPLIALTCLYLAIVYALFYIFFQSFPIIYGGVYGFSPGQTGLAFIPIGIGALIACPLYLAWDSYLARAQALSKPWALKEESRRLPLACAAGPFLVLSIFWSGFTAKPHIHWAVPAASGIPFGIGYLLLFMGMINYLVDAYSVYAASASAASSASRSLFGAVLPFAARPMYDALGVRWASGTLGFVTAAIAVVPFMFIVYGARLRARSPFCQYLANQSEEMKKAWEKQGTVGRDEEELPEVVESE